jgi:hypothetical protein
MSAVEAYHERRIEQLRAALALVRKAHEDSRYRNASASLLWATYGPTVEAALKEDE